MAEIKTSAFCGLSRSEDWQNWLKETAPDLHEDLMKTVSAARGCRANSNKMMDIYFELNKRKLEPELLIFLRRRFPWIIRKDTDLPPTEEFKTQLRKSKIANSIKNIQNSKDWNSLNKHRVFASYRPDILSFPQKFIIIDEPANLYDRVQRFVEGKLAVDYIIIGNHAYIEYFEPKYAAVIDKIPRTVRDIYKYRLKIQQQNAQ